MIAFYMLGGFAVLLFLALVWKFLQYNHGGGSGQDDGAND